MDGVLVLTNNDQIEQGDRVMHNFQNLQSLNSDLTPDVMIQVDEIVNHVVKEFRS